jgi:hypothetical protein
MNPVRFSSAAWLLVVGAVAVAAAQAQGPKPSELRAEVPAYSSMHDVIMPMWHDAWPAKDTKALAKMLPSIERHTAAIADAELPGVLREKKTAWDEGVTKLQVATQDYRAAVKSGNPDLLLGAAEKLHMTYEALGRVIRPVLVEIEAFHETLYVIYHYQMNPPQFAKLAASVPELKTKMDALNLARLPDTVKDRAASFGAQRARLSKAVDTLVASMAAKDETRVAQGVELIHIEYQKLVKTFED